MNPPEKEKEMEKVTPEVNLPPEINLDNLRSATKKEKNEIMKFYYEYVT
jgi:hypothetical protein